MITSNLLTEIRNKDNFLKIETEGALFQVYLLDENIIRIRATFNKNFSPEASYALVKTAWSDATDELMKDERTHVKPIKIHLIENKDRYSVSTGKLILNIFKNPFSFQITDMNGNVLHQDLPKRSFLQDELGRSYHYSSMGDHNYFYGFGEKSGELNKFKRRMRMHNTDSLGWNAAKTDPLYKMIPFYIDFNGENGIASGVFYNNSFDSLFDIDCEHSNYWKRFSYFECDGGDIDFFFIGGPKIKDVVEHYTDLTGKTAMMPIASLGYMGSTMYYTELDENSDEAILNFVDTCKKNNIPCDGFFLSSGYTSGDNQKRYVFNWNKKRFPKPKVFIEELKKRGVLLAPNVKPGLLNTHPLTSEFQQKNAFIKNSDGTKDQVDQYWGGAAHFVDFTSENGRAEWSKHLTESLLSMGISTIWNDNNEYEIADNDAIVSMEGLQNKIGAVKPLMSTLMAKTAKDAMHKYSPDTRPYIINRAGFAGIQRYAQTWAGDNRTSWNNLKYNIPTILGMGLSGVANQGCDIGGFDGPAPDPELFVRWVQNGIFQPRFSIHSSNSDNTVTEPWMYPDYTKYIQEAIKLRYRLIPYFYSLLHEASTKGYPIMRPLVYEFQDDPKVAEESFEFMLGSSLLIANVVEKKATKKKIYLPAGSNWFDMNTSEYYLGGQTIEIPVTLESIPMFLRTGGIIPEYPNLMNIHNDNIDHLKLFIEPSTVSEFRLYEDDGKTMRYKNGEYLETLIKVSPSNDNLIITMSSVGNFESTIKNIDLSICCDDIVPLTISIDSKQVPKFLNLEKFQLTNCGWFFDGEKKQVIVRYLNSDKSEYNIVLNYKVKDLISL